MVKRKNQALIDSDSSKSDISDLDSVRISRDIEYTRVRFRFWRFSSPFRSFFLQEFLSLAKKKNKTKKVNQKDNQRHDSETDSSDSESDTSNSKKNPQPKKRNKRSGSSNSSASEKEKPVPKLEDAAKTSEPEEGEVSDSSGSSSEEEFNDGYDDQLMGDAEDRARLASLTEKERETEIFKRIEQRELMKTRLVWLGSEQAGFCLFFFLCLLFGVCVNNVWEVERWVILQVLW